MKYKHVFAIALLSVGSMKVQAQQDEAHEQQMHTMASEIQQTNVRIAILLYPDVVLQDFAGPMEVFSKAKNLSQGKYTVFTVAKDLKPVQTENGLLQMTPDYTLENMPTADYLIIPGASMPVMHALVDDKVYLDFIKRWSKKNDSHLVTVCTGAYLVAPTGAFDGKKITTHYFVADDLAEQYPKATVVKDVRFVDEGNIITSSGVTSGIDVALYLVGKQSGEKMKAMIERAMQYTYHEEEKWPVAPNGMRYRSQ